MKKFFMYVIIVVVALFISFATYYFLRNNETITCTISSDKSLYLNVDDTFDLPIVWTKQNKYTTLDISIPKVNNDDILEYDESNQVFKAVSAGLVTVTITPSNANFGPFKFNVFIGDGSKDNPYYIKSAKELNRIGRDEFATSEEKKFGLNNSYQLTADIDLSEIGEWAPIGSSVNVYNGSFNGDGHTIFNLNITQTHENAGLFAVVGCDASIENLKIQDAKLETNSTNVGCVAGTNIGFIGKVEIKNATITNALTDSNNGAIVGVNTYSNDTKNRATVQMCSADIKLSTSGYTGGLVGKNICSVVFDSYAIINSYTLKEGYLAFGGLIGFDESKSYLKNVVKKNELTNTFETVQQEGYTSSVVKNCFVVLSSAILTSQDRCANFIGKFSDENIDRKTSYYINNYYTFPESDGAISINCAIASGYSTDGAMSQADMISYLIKGNMRLKDSFKGWFNGEIWTLEDGQLYPELNFDAMYSKLSVFDESVPISSKEYVLEMLKIIAKDPSMEQTFNIDATDNVLDLGGAEFTTIAKDSTQPMKANILVAEGKTFTIKNFKLVGDNHSFFGYISNATIQGLKFEDVIIEHNKLAGSAVIATDLYTGASLEKCSVENINVVSNARNIGLISAQNSNGIIENCNVKFGANISTIDFASANANCGAIVGQNKASVKNCEVEGVRTNINSKASKAFANVGGAIGSTDGAISDVYVYGTVAILDNSNASGTLGGVVGTSSANITSCFSLAIITAKEANQYLLTGGITAVLGYDATLTKSFYGNAGEEGGEGSALKGFYAGGLVCENYGTVTECYVRCSIAGIRIGGLGVFCYGRFENCGVYDGTQLDGTSKDTARVSGLVSLMKTDGVVKHCLSSASFGGEVMEDLVQISWYAETETEIRVLGFMRAYMKYLKEQYVDCTWEDNAIINYGSAKIQYAAFEGWQAKFNYAGFTKLTAEQCKGEDNYSAIIGMGFEGDSSETSRTPWVFPDFEKDTYMYLRHVVKNPQAVSSEVEE